MGGYLCVSPPRVFPRSVSSRHRPLGAAVYTAERLIPFESPARLRMLAHGNWSTRNTNNTEYLVVYGVPYDERSILCESSASGQALGRALDTAVRGNCKVHDHVFCFFVEGCRCGFPDRGLVDAWPPRKGRPASQNRHFRRESSQGNERMSRVGLPAVAKSRRWWLLLFDCFFCFPLVRASSSWC